MKKVKQILAILGIVVLVALYLSTLVLAIIDDANTMNLFMASVVATVMLPVLIWAYGFVYRLLKGPKNSLPTQDEDKQNNND